MFKGTCGRVRRTDDGEQFWECMMKDKVVINELEFLSHVTIEDVLSIDESWENMRNVADREGDSFKFFRSGSDCYFMQQAGFEWIWTNC